MNILKKEAKDLLRELKIKPSKGLGQNFLIDKSAINKVLNALDISLNDTVLEVGPGFGMLTKELVKKAKKVVSVEKDRNMVNLLEKECLVDNLEIVNQDILQFNPKFKDYVLVGNIPFYLTAPVIRKFLETENRPKQIVFIIQKEVAQRISANPPRMSILAVSVQIYADTKITSYIKKDSFWPKPKIDSAIIKIIPKEFPKMNMDLFFKTVKAGFSQPRKQLLNNLSKGLYINKTILSEKLSKININPTQRAETLSIKDWINLSKRIKIT